MGVNLTSHPGDTETPATDLASAGAVSVTPESALALLAGHFERWRSRWALEGFAPLRDAWLARAWRLGETIRVRLDRETMEGRFAGLDRDGVLVLELSSGLKRLVTAGAGFSAGGPVDAGAGGRGELEERSVGAGGGRRF